VNVVRVSGKIASAWETSADGKHRRLRVPAIGFARVAIEYGTGSIHETWIGLAEGVEVDLTEVAGARIVARPAGKRCGRVAGYRGKWGLCHGWEELSPGASFELVCANPAYMFDESFYWIDRSNGETVLSPEFVPTLPGLYLAKYKKGKIVVSYEASDCASAKPLSL